MVVTESECIDCDLPCIYESCKYYQVTRYYCDQCGDEIELFWFDGRQLCINCIEDQLERVEIDE